MRAGTNLAVVYAAEHVEDDIHHDVRAAVEAWLHAVARREVKHIVDLYEHNAVLLPTLWPGVHDTPEQRHAYFEGFTTRKKLKGELTHLVIQLPEPTVAVASGLYTFSYANGKGEIKRLPARYTFVLAWKKDRWMIIHHHSSAEPKALS